jgi:hypothetical protein
VRWRGKPLVRDEEALSGLNSVAHLIYAVTGVLETVAKQNPLPLSEEIFWRLWDRGFDKIIATAREEPPPDGDDWVGRALNRPAGELTNVLLDLTFRRGLKAGHTLPSDLKPRFEKVVAAEPTVLRLGRVMMVSRLAYLFAVDPNWVRTKLIPYLDWNRSEDEAVALWRAYAWQPRISAELWVAISSHLLDAFTPERLARLDSDGARLGVLLTVVGIELPEMAMPIARVRAAILAMDSRGRAESLSWIWRLLEASKQEASPSHEGGPDTRADWLWKERVRPWLLRVWPRRREAIDQETSDQFALIAIITDHRFAEAVETLLPFIGPVHYWRLPFHGLAKSLHPDQSPVADFGSPYCAAYTNSG